MQDRRAGRARRLVRSAGPRIDRPRGDEWRGGAVHGLPRAGHQTDPRLRGLPRRRPHPARPRATGPFSSHPARGHARLATATWSSSPRPGFWRVTSAASRPIDMAQVADHAEGVIALTGCLQSRFCQYLVDGRVDQARAHADELIWIFGDDNVYFEVQKNGVAAQDKANEGIVRIARELGGPLVGTGDVHYLRREDYNHHAALLCVQTKSTLSRTEDHLRYQRVLPALERGDGRGVRRVARGGRHHAGDRGALRCRARARPAADPALPDPGRGHGGRVPALARARGAAPSAMATLRRPRRWSAPNSSSA